METVVESGIEFTYTPQVSFVKHDAQNTQWPGVDFIIDETTRWIWLEVKNWEPSHLQPARRGGQRWSFLSKMRSTVWFKNILRGKFLGTSAFLAHEGTFQAKDVLFVVLLESPRMDAALMLQATTRLRQHAWPSGPWTHSISAAVMNLAEWNLRFPDYHAHTL